MSIESPYTRCMVVRQIAYHTAVVHTVIIETSHANRAVCQIALPSSLCTMTAQEECTSPVRCADEDW
jgi:hypothetical protein